MESANPEFMVGLSTQAQSQFTLGLCHRLPGLDYLHWEALGVNEPKSDQYDLFCKQCWPKGFGAEDETEAEEESTSDNEEHTQA